MFRAALAAVLVTAACGDDGDITPEPLANAPAATRALLPGDHVIAIGGDSAFGLAKLVHRDGDAWRVASGPVPFGSRAQLFSGDVPYAASETTLYRQDDPDRFAWSAAAIPPASGGQVTPIAVIGDTLYGEMPDQGGGAIVRWAPGTAIWREVTRPIGAGARAFLVEADRITWSDPERGVVRAEGGAQIVLADCTREELGACSTALLPLAYAPSGDLAVVGCPRDAPPIAAVRVHGDELVPVKLPDDVAPCVAATGGYGHGLVVTEDALYELSPNGNSWTRIAASEPGLTYVHAGGEVYAYGDGISARGIYVLDL